MSRKNVAVEVIFAMPNGEQYNVELIYEPGNLKIIKILEDLFESMEKIGEEIPEAGIYLLHGLEDYDRWQDIARGTKLALKRADLRDDDALKIKRLILIDTCGRVIIFTRSEG